MFHQNQIIMEGNLKLNDKTETCSLPDGLTFEKALERLEAVVEKMESGKLPLEEMMKYFEEGSKLSSLCGKKLKELEKKIEILVGGESDDPKWTEFGQEKTADKPVKAKSPGRVKKPEDTEPRAKDTELPF